MLAERKNLQGKSSEEETGHRCFTRRFGACALQNETSLNRTVSVISSFLLSSVNGITLVLGNLSVYTTSYTKARVDSSKASESNWILSLYITGFGVGSLLSSVLQHKISKRSVCIIASLLNVCGLMTSYFSLQASVFALSVTLGGVSGVSGGAMINTSLQLVYPWLDKSKGFVTSIIRTSASIYAFGMNYFVTVIINPGDKQPDVNTSDLSYFNQDEILDRVPFIFLYLGLTNAFILFIGCLLIREKKLRVTENDNQNIGKSQINAIKKNARLTLFESSEKRHVSKSNEMEYSSLNNISQKLSQPQDRDENVKPNVFFSMSEIRSNFSNSALLSLHNNTHNMARDMTKRMTQSLTNLQSTPCQNSDLKTKTPASNVEITIEMERVEESPVLLTYRQLLTSKDAYIIYLILAIYTLQYNFTLKYYKLIAQIWIKDDYFLTNLGTVLSISLLVFRPLWGVVADKFGLKNAIILTLSMTSCTISWLYITPAVHRWLYCVVVYILWNTVNALPILSPFIPNKLYGNQNFSKAYGLQTMALSLCNLLTPVLLQLALEYVLWNTILSGIAFTGLVGVVLVISYFPNIH